MVIVTRPTEHGFFYVSLTVGISSPRKILPKMAHHKSSQKAAGGHPMLTLAGSSEGASIAGSIASSESREKWTPERVMSQEPVGALPFPGETPRSQSWAELSAPVKLSRNHSGISHSRSSILHSLGFQLLPDGESQRGRLQNQSALVEQQLARHGRGSVRLIVHECASCFRAYPSSIASNRDTTREFGSLL